MPKYIDLTADLKECRENPGGFRQLALRVPNSFAATVFEDCIAVGETPNARIPEILADYYRKQTSGVMFDLSGTNYDALLKIAELNGQPIGEDPVRKAAAVAAAARAIVEKYVLREFKATAENHSSISVLFKALTQSLGIPLGDAAPNPNAVTEAASPTESEAGGGQPEPSKKSRKKR